MPADASEITVRHMSVDDAVNAARLCEQLGYPVAADDMRRRIEEILRLADHALFVACRDTEVIGWVHAMEVLHLQSERRVEIGGLVSATFLTLFVLPALYRLFALRAPEAEL